MCLNTASVSDPDQYDVIVSLPDLLNAVPGGSTTLVPKTTSRWAVTFGVKPAGVWANDEPHANSSTAKAFGTFILVESKFRAV